MRSNSTMTKALLRKETILTAIMLFSLTSINALSAESELVTITNDETPTVYKMVIDTNHNKDIQKFYKDTYEQNRRVEREHIPLSKITVGVNLEKRDKYEVVNLKSENFASHNGGHLEIDTLYNGAKGTRKIYDLEIDRIGDNWEILKDGKTVKELHLKSNRVFLLGTVGIKDIEITK